MPTTSTTPATLLPDVLNYLDITWADDATNQKVTGIIARGMAYLDRAAGKQQDYKKESAARALLFDYVRYVRSNALDEFLTNYLPELLGLQIHQQVADAMPQEVTPGD